LLVGAGLVFSKFVESGAEFPQPQVPSFVAAVCLDVKESPVLPKGELFIGTGFWVDEDNVVTAAHVVDLNDWDDSQRWREAISQSSYEVFILDTEGRRHDVEGMVMWVNDRDVALLWVKEPHGGATVSLANRVVGMEEVVKIWCWLYLPNSLTAANPLEVLFGMSEVERPINAVQLRDVEGTMQPFVIRTVVGNGSLIINWGKIDDEKLEDLIAFKPGVWAGCSGSVVFGVEEKGIGIVVGQIGRPDVGLAEPIWRVYAELTHLMQGGAPEDAPKGGQKKE